MTVSMTATRFSAMAPAVPVVGRYSASPFAGAVMREPGVSGGDAFASSAGIAPAAAPKFGGLIVNKYTIGGVVGFTIATLGLGGTYALLKDGAEAIDQFQISISDDPDGAQTEEGLRACIDDLSPEASERLDENLERVADNQVTGFVTEEDVDTTLVNCRTLENGARRYRFVSKSGKVYQVTLPAALS